MNNEEKYEILEEHDICIKMRMWLIGTLIEKKVLRDQFGKEGSCQNCRLGNLQGQLS